MQKNEFETMVKELLPNATEQAIEKWTQYEQEQEQEQEQELEQDGTEKASDLYDAAYVELRLIKEHQGEAVAASLFNYGEQFVFNYFELRGAAAKLTEGWTLEQIRDYTIENGCDPPTRNTGNPHRRCRRSAASRSIHFPARCACNMLRFAAILCCF